MSNCSLTTDRGVFVEKSGKTATYLLNGPTSYDTGGSVVDLSADFVTVHGVQVVGQPTAANDHYLPTFIPAGGFAPATGKVKIRDLSAGTIGAEVAATTNLSAVQFVVRVTGT